MKRPDYRAELFEKVSVCGRSVSWNGRMIVSDWFHIVYIAPLKAAWRYKMNIENRYMNGEGIHSKENFNVELTNPMLYDRLNALSSEYSVSVAQLVNVAVKRLIDDVDFVRGLRIGKIKPE